MLVFTSQSQEKLMQTVMVVSSLFATMAFQVGVNPPGGVWQDNFKEHMAGKAMLAYEYPNSYACFMFFNTVGFLLSLFLILSILATAVPVTRNPRGLLLPVISWLTIMTTAFAYTYSVVVVSPKHMMAVTNTILVSVIVWAVVMILLAVEVVAAFELSRSKKDLEIMSRLARVRLRLLPNAVGENVSNV
ncbi:hypothetical protein RHMOL_Rhmol01G0016400 [Rhododendron molle]|uniref:Uncharacterized protein n=1 Tax=Rhododendron molle TaxID=49168 RepID=A0ACC0PWU0_RHOML|nr:hypothetical protein RHMOL_Rhmol01G0016400 [Rhododendron molle]